MAVRAIVKNGDEVLSKKCRAVEKFDERLWTLLDDMAETMYGAHGVGLAAPQVGILRRVVTIDVGDGLIELINPEIIHTSGRQREVEGCLSCPNQWGYVVRPAKVKVRAQNRNGEWFEVGGKELMASCLCHEIDHLDGHLFIEKVDEFVQPNEE